ncbi:MAG: 50S ribosomal protein L1, partial [Planctomycetota bacterium]
MRKLSRRYRAALETPGSDTRRRYPLSEGLHVLAGFPKPKFDETVELCVRLGIDPKRTDQMVRGSVSLPKGIGKTRTVAVFAEGEQAEAAEEAGADIVGAADLAKRIQDGFMDFDVCIAHQSMMRHVGKLGKILGPQGKMPSPKSGTVTDRIADAVREFKAGKVEFRADSGASVHVPVGKRSFPAEDLEANIVYFVDHLRGLKPAAVKGAFV